jgi:hypothetical protein
MQQKSFYQYFKQNMNALGLPAPDSLFGTLGAATGTITTLANLVLKFGPKVTLTEVLGSAPSLAIRASEIGVVAGAMLATYYLGACIGSFGSNGANDFRRIFHIRSVCRSGQNWHTARSVDA